MLKYQADLQYQYLLKATLYKGDTLKTRNHSCISNISALQARFDTFPLVTLRRTAWRKALREMEWFMSGEEKCPDELLDWWAEQLNPQGLYLKGYSSQLRYYTSKQNEPVWEDLEPYYFDQIAFILDSIKYHPHSRRLITTTWHPEEMANITKINENPQSPSCCHGTNVQYFVRNGELYMNVLARSQDLLLGVPHNWVQYWGLLLFLSYHTGLKPGVLTWTFGDAHIYDDPSHLEPVQTILYAEPPELDLSLVYNYSGALDFAGLPAFIASDFSVVGDIPKPVTTTRPKLF